MRVLLILAILSTPLMATDLDFSNLRAEQPARSLFKIERGALGDPESDHEMGDVSLGGSVGIAFSRTAFYTSGEADFWLARFFSLGPLVQVAAGDDFLLGVTGGPKITFDFDDNDFSNFAKPYTQLGLGFVLIAGDRGPRRDRRNDSDVGLLINYGFGIDFYLDEHLSLGTGFMFNFMPTDPLDDSFFWAWKLIEAKYHF